MNDTTGNARSDAAGPPPSEARAGLVYALAAYGWWGMIPLYFALVAHVPSVTVLAHRVVWSLVFLAIILGVQRRWREIVAVLRSPRMLGLLAVAAILIGLNWWIFIYAVASDRVLEASLGYYLNPLVSVLLGVAVLGERLRRWQWASVLLAAGGVAFAAAGRGAWLPWIPLVLSLTFSLYSLIRKLVPVGPMVGLFVETLVLVAPAGAVLMYGPAPALHHRGPGLDLLLMAAGVVTAMPLLWFASAVRRLSLTTVGFLQYLSPSLQFAVAVLVLGETLDVQRLLSFALIWAALAIYTFDAVRIHGRAAALAAIELPD